MHHTSQGKSWGKGRTAQVVVGLPTTPGLHCQQQQLRLCVGEGLRRKTGEKGKTYQFKA
jgi:hypothetical protein